MIKIKNIVLLIGFALFLSGVFGVLSAHAQLLISGVNLNNNFDRCGLYNSNVVGANQNSDPPAPISIVGGKNYGITGSYNLNINCQDQAGKSDCVALTNAVNAMEATAAKISNFPQPTQSPSNNSITFEFVHNGGQNGLSWELDSVELQPDGTTIKGKYSRILIDEDSSQKGQSFQQAMANPNFLASQLAHEISHSFGLADAYSGTFSNGQAALGTMGQAEALEIYNDPSLPAFFWDPSAIAVIQAINQGLTINLDPNQNDVVCNNQCQDYGSNLIMSFQPGDDGLYDITCSSPPTTLSSDETVSYSDCTCGGSDPSCTNLETGESNAPTSYQCPPAGGVGDACVSVNPLCPNQAAIQGTIQQNGSCSESQLACGDSPGNPGDICYSETNSNCPNQPASQGYFLPSGSCSAPATACTSQYSESCTVTNPDCPDQGGSTGFIQSDGTCSAPEPVCPPSP